MTAWTLGLDQVATYWAPSSKDRFGKQVFADPVVIACRWQDVAERFINPNGEEKTSSTVVYPDRLLELGGLLVEGETDEAPEVAGAKIIQQRGRSPSLGLSIELHKVWL